MSDDGAQKVLGGHRLSSLGAGETSPHGGTQTVSRGSDLTAPGLAEKTRASTADFPLGCTLRMDDRPKINLNKPGSFVVLSKGVTCMDGPTGHRVK